MRFTPADAGQLPSPLCPHRTVCCVIGTSAGRARASPSEEAVFREETNPPAMQEAWVRSLGGEEALDKGMAVHSSIPAWEILWTEEPGKLQSMGLQRVGCD